MRLKRRYINQKVVIAIRVGKKRISPMRLKHHAQVSSSILLQSRKEENLTYEIETESRNRWIWLSKESERRESHLWDWNNIQSILQGHGSQSRKEENLTYEIETRRLKSWLSLQMRRKEENLTYEIETNPNSSPPVVSFFSRKEENLTYEIETPCSSIIINPPPKSERRESHLWDWNRISQSVDMVK